MPSEMEKSMESLMMAFHRYANEDGDGKTLTKKELKKLMEAELSGFLECQRDPNTVDRIMKDLDTNGDGKVDFEEFMSLVVGLTCACEKLYQLQTCKK